jgi:creatinine amidohydrolase
MPLGGTFTLDLDTFRAVLSGVAGSIARHGFHRILVLNGHGGNIAALNAAAHELQASAGVALAVATYWQVAEARIAAILERQDGVRHAGEAETSMMLAVRPDLVDGAAMSTADGPSAALGPVGGVQRWRPIDHWSGHGVVGAPSAATAEKGERLLTAVAEAVAERLGDPAIWD